MAKLKDLLLAKNSTVAIFNNIVLCHVLGENKLKTGACSEKNGRKVYELIKDGSCVNQYVVKKKQKGIQNNYLIGKQERNKAGTETDQV